MNNRGKRIIRLSIYFIYLIVCLGLYEHIFVYHVKMNGSSHEVINIDTSFKDPGILVKLRGKAYNDVLVEGEVDSSKAGTYVLKYSFGNKSKTRVVEVRDIEKPTISLVNTDVIVNYGDEYKEPGYRAKDNIDGDITNDVIVINGVNVHELGEYNIKYYVKDSSNNETLVTRKVIVSDIEGPKISFKDSINTSIIKGNKKELNDYEVYDNYDGYLTKQVKIDGIVNYNKIGQYKLTYSVKDSHGNETVIERKINVQNKNTSGIPVLMYHWFYDDTKGETNRGKANAHNYISKTQLTNQLKYLTSSGFYFPTWQELVDYIDGKIDLPEKSIIITDDDCRDSFLEIGLPIFQEYKVPVTSFCITSKHNWQKYKNEDYLLFESHTDDMHKIACGGWNGAMMCKTHDEILDDLKVSIEKVGASDSFAYPYGHYNDTAIEALKDSGIKLAFTTNSGRVKKYYNKYLLPRVRISSSTTLNEYKNLVN